MAYKAHGAAMASIPHHFRFADVADSTWQNVPLADIGRTFYHELGNPRRRQHGPCAHTWYTMTPVSGLLASESGLLMRQPATTATEVMIKPEPQSTLARR